MLFNALEQPLVFFSRPGGKIGLEEGVVSGMYLVGGPVRHEIHYPGPIVTEQPHPYHDDKVLVVGEGALSQGFPQGVYIALKKKHYFRRQGKYQHDKWKIWTHRS